MANGLFKEIIELDFPGAEASFKKAIELNPGYAEAHREYGLFLTRMGLFTDALEELQTAQRYDPFSPLIIRDIGNLYVFSGRAEEGVILIKASIAIDSTNTNTLGDLAWAHYENDNKEEAFKIFKSLNDIIRLYVVHKLGAQEAEAQAMLDSIQTWENISSYFRAIIFLLEGNHDMALKRLEDAYELREGFLIFLRTDSIWDPIRDIEEFKALERKLKFPELE